MDINELLELETQKTLMENGAGWVLAIEMLVSQMESLSEQVQDIETRMVMYDKPLPEPVAKEDPFTTESWAEDIVPTAEENLAGARVALVASQVLKLIRSGDAERERKDAGLSAAAVGNKVGVTGGAVRGWETGQWFPSPSAAERYLDFLMGLRHGTKVEVPETPPKKAVGEPNGLKCVYCGKDLTGKQSRYCSKECTNSYSYIKQENRDATPEEMRTLVAGVGWADNGQKRRKYKKLDQIKAEQDVERARTAKVPALA